MTVRVKIYTTATCPYCVRAKQLLDRKGVAYEEVDVSGNQELADEMFRLTGKITVPQILIGGSPVGGCDELYNLEHRGELDRILQSH